MKNYKKFINFLKNIIRDYCSYVWNCGFFYDFPSNGFPLNKMDSPFCGLKIGGENHIPVKRPGNFRIIKDKAHYDLLKSYWKGFIDKIQYKYYEDFKKEVEQKED